jgi:peptidoglycan lytic transglycosylase
MRWMLIIVPVFLALPLCAQEEDHKPSPFPEINRERETTRKAANPVSPKRHSMIRPRSGSAERAEAVVPQGPGIGTACYFNSKEGAPTASGEESKTEEFVAAHATYAFGSRVLVTNLANGNTIEVRITDRLSDSRRIISVNESAAIQLGFREQGVATVKVEMIRAAEVHP